MERKVVENMSKPVVAIVGRPNVGKSTLFNTLAGERISIVKDTPGVTRDRIYADVSWLDKEFTMIDTGGIEPDSSDIILSQMREQAQIAIDTADVIVFITDVRQGLRRPGWESVICWMKWFRIFRKEQERPKRTSVRRSPLSESRMWENLRSSISFSEKTG